MSDPRALVGYVHGGWPRNEFMTSVLNLTSGPTADPNVGGVLGFTAGALLSMARNGLTQAFLDTELEWLFSVDTDIEFLPTVLSRLMATADPEKRPVVSAMYHRVYQGEIRPIMLTAGKDKDDNLKYVQYAPEEDWTPGDVIQLDGIGAGCVLIHRSVLEKMEKANGKHWWTELFVGGKHIGEDLSFCLQATSLDIPIHVDTGIQVGHHKMVRLGEPN